MWVCGLTCLSPRPCWPTVQSVARALACPGRSYRRSTQRGSQLSRMDLSAAGDPRTIQNCSFKFWTSDRGMGKDGGAQGLQIGSSSRSPAGEKSLAWKCSGNGGWVCRTVQVIGTNVNRCRQTARGLSYIRHQYLDLVGGLSLPAY